MSFLAGKSAMAALIRGHRWSDTPLGPPETWPQSLRSALSICLHSAFPTAIYWGPELRLLYNDAWATIPGPRHPGSLGRPAREVWSDIWHILEPQFAEILATGEGLYLANQMLPMRRFGAPEETYWNYSLTAIRGEDGAIAGVFNSGNEITHSVMSQRQMAFLVELGEALRATPDPKQAGRLAIRMLGAHLGVDRTGLVEIAPDSDLITVAEDWTAPGVRQLEGPHRLSDYGAWIHDRLVAGNVVRINDVASDPDIAEAGTRAAYDAIDVAAGLMVPWFCDGRLVAAIVLHSHHPRIWSDFEIATAQSVIDWTWSWMERERARLRELIMAREIDHRAKNALAVVQSVVRLTRADDMPEFRSKIEGRISALARAHNLLSNQRWNAIDLGLLVGQELAAYASREAHHVRIEGPPVLIPPELAQILALVLHELATNATKHGALSGRGGGLRVTWRRIEDALHIDWQERLPDGCALADGLKRTGFGSVLFYQVVEKQLHGSIARTWHRHGLEFALTIPFSR